MVIQDSDQDLGMSSSSIAVIVQFAAVVVVYDAIVGVVCGSSYVKILALQLTTSASNAGEEIMRETYLIVISKCIVKICNVIDVGTAGRRVEYEHIVARAADQCVAAE